MLVLHENVKIFSTINALRLHVSESLTSSLKKPRMQRQPIAGHPQMPSAEQVTMGATPFSGCAFSMHVAGTEILSGPS